MTDRLSVVTESWTRRRALRLGGAVLVPVAAGCGPFGQAAGAPGAPSSDPSGVSTTRAAPPAAPAPPTTVPPTPTPAPTPVPEPREYAIESGWYFAVPGYAVRDEPGGPRFWTELQRQGGVQALGLPTARSFNAPASAGLPEGSRVQRFQQGWLVGTQAGVRRGDGVAPEPPPDALAREDRPEMAFIGRVDVSPRDARQGTTVLIRVWSTAAQSATVTLEGRDQQLVKDGEAFVGLFGIHRNLSQLGARPLRFTLVDGAGRRVTRNDAADTFRVVNPEYPTEDLIVDPKTMTLLDPVKVNQEEAFVSGIMGKFTPERYWKGPFAEPMFSPAGPVPLSSEFGTKRSINGVSTGWAHEGTDYEVDTGDPILACADGKVAYIGELGTRGKVVIIDHGWSVMTGYFHMFQQQVQEGQMVKKGQQIGLVGSTGFVTGPHLHVEVRVRNVTVEPLEWFQRAPFSRPDLASL